MIRNHRQSLREYQKATVLQTNQRQNCSNLKIYPVIDKNVIEEKIASANQAAGTCTYIILTESPCKQSTGEMIKAKEIPIIKITKKIELMNLINLSIQTIIFPKEKNSITS